MNKQDLHLKLQTVQESINIPESEFIEVYGNNRKQMIGGQEMDRAAILAKTYNLSVEFTNSIYTFTVH